MVADIELIEGVEMIRIADVGEMAPFLMTIVSSCDLWMFVSGSGGLTAGRVDRDTCLFPYETDDRLHAPNGRAGPATVLRIRTDTDDVIWEPFRGNAGPIRRHLLKSVLGDAIVFEEEHLALSLTIRARWAPSERFGWVRTVSLTRVQADTGSITVDIVDGLCDLMPWGIDVPLQQRMSNLANAYRRSEVVQPGVGIFALEAMIVDRPEPAEALRATTVWSTGLEQASITLDPTAIDDARLGRPFRPTSLRTGRPGSFLMNESIDLEPGRTHRWHVVADVARDHADIESLRALLDSGADVAQHVDDDIRRSSAALRQIVATADGLQLTGSRTNDAHHLANTLFNVMRGGTLLFGDTIDTEHFRSFVAERNATTAARQSDRLTELPVSVSVDALGTAAAEVGDPDLMRLASEYLPLTFSRRHGDPSRPWNQFAIRVRDARDDPILSYQGNWRDIFQNWEALMRSFPAYLPSVIAKFVSASTGDGFNPYRITSEGIDWEIIDPDDPWSGIGYWGDHQIVYLDRLLRAQEAHDPEWLMASLDVRAYAFADVPYRIVPYDDLVADAKSTVVYDDAVAAAVAERVEAIGADGKLVADGSGAVVHVTLFEKLLIPALAKISNFVPRGGIWMNTQRPEWNDANNALAGFGLSMVTLAHLRRYVQLLDRIATDRAEPIQVSEDVVTWLATVTDVLEAHHNAVGAPEVDGSQRAAILRGLGGAYSAYRATWYAAGPSRPTALPAAAVSRFTSVALRHLDDAIRAAQRPDGLYHAYNVIAFSPDGCRADVNHLPMMLEGQVAAISSGLLAPHEVIDLVEAMYDSPLYRPDVDSFVLYPVRSRPSFLDRNLVPAEAVNSNPLLTALVDAGNDDVVVRDVRGRYHFSGDFRNADDLRAALDRLEREATPLVADHRADTLALFEQVFGHHEFTGRSSTMYAYEGIGSVYWHMVAKLLVAVQECALAAGAEHDAAELVRLYERIRAGLGFNKSPGDYGAFPTDPYSHTPAHAGAQQPGMTGQVKEELLTRWAELGLTVDAGRLHFTPLLLDAREFVSRERTLALGTDGSAPIQVSGGTAAYTVCQVPVVLHEAAEKTSIIVTFADGKEHRVDGGVLDAAISKEIFGRTGVVARLDIAMTPRDGATLPT